MLYHNRIDISEGIHRAKSNASEECMVCHYWIQLIEVTNLKQLIH